MCTELAKLNHPAQPEANELFTLFRVWLCRQFSLLGSVTNADELAMHLLARSQGVATLAGAFQDETFIRQEVEQLHAWLSAHTKSSPRDDTGPPRTSEKRRRR